MKLLAASISALLNNFAPTLSLSLFLMLVLFLKTSANDMVMEVFIFLEDYVPWALNFNIENSMWYFIAS